MAQYIEAIGRRKESTARVRVTEGSGVFTVNDKPLDVYFPRSEERRVGKEGSCRRSPYH